MPHNEKFTGLEKIDLASAELHAPVEVTFAVYIHLPDGRMGSMRAAMPPGQIPSRADLKLVLDSFTDADGKIPGAPVGARLATRSEFVAHIVKRETGQPFNLDAGAQYSPIPSDIPHSMLVHAIHGAGVPWGLRAEFDQKGMLGMDGECNDTWIDGKLDKLPDDMLLALYERVTT